MSFLVIPLACFLASILTFFSGFGLGTVLTPIFALWFPIEAAVGMTAIVHLLNNAFKLVLVGRHSNRKVVLSFGAPAIVAAALGAWVLTKISHQPPLFEYQLGEKTFQILPVKLTFAVLIAFFTVFELIPALKKWTVHKKYLPVGGLLSGFFGGLSGHQGALRSAFLIRAGLTKESFIATGVVIACFIDLVRLPIYLGMYSHQGWVEHVGLLGLATLAAFVGAYMGNKQLAKTTLGTVQTLVSVCLLALSAALGAGLI